jgi:hypothetical protein
MSQNLSTERSTFPWESLTNPQLQVLLRAMGSPVSGRKADLCLRARSLERDSRMMQRLCCLQFTTAHDSDLIHGLLKLAEWGVPRVNRALLPSLLCSSTSWWAVEALLKYTGVDGNPENRPLHTAAKQGSYWTVQALVKAGADVNIEAADGPHALDDCDDSSGGGVDERQKPRSTSSSGAHKQATE